MFGDSKVGPRLVTSYGAAIAVLTRDISDKKAVEQCDKTLNIKK